MTSTGPFGDFVSKPRRKKKAKSTRFILGNDKCFHISKETKINDYGAINFNLSERTADIIEIDEVDRDKFIETLEEQIILLRSYILGRAPIDIALNNAVEEARQMAQLVINDFNAPLDISILRQFHRYVLDIKMIEFLCETYKLASEHKADLIRVYLTKNVFAGVNKSNGKEINNNTTVLSKPNI